MALQLATSSYINQALNRPTSESSTCCNGRSWDAVDGNTDPSYGAGYVERTHHYSLHTQGYHWALALHFSMSIVKLFHFPNH